MHHPPEVRFSVASSPWPRRFARIAGALAILQVGWFLFLNWKPSWPLALVGTSLLLALGWARLEMQVPTTGTLRWDGQQWQWSDFADSACLMQRHLDFQGLMLVSLHRPNGRTVWLWLQRSHDPYHWLALRRAVVHSTAPGQVHRIQGSTQASHAAIA